MKAVSNIFVRTGKRTPDYCFAVRSGAIVQVHTFSTREAAETAREKA